MSHNTNQPTEDALWWLSFERPQYAQPIISAADIRQGVRFRFYHSHWSRHHHGLRLFDSWVMSIRSGVSTDNSAPREPYIHAPRSVVECYDHDSRSKRRYALSQLGLEPHRTQWGSMWDLSSFCTLTETPRMRWDEPRPKREGMLNIGDLQKSLWIHSHSGGLGARLMRVMSEVTHRTPQGHNSAYGGLVVSLYDPDLQQTRERRLEDLGILPYVNPNGERWGDAYCTLAPKK